MTVDVLPARPLAPSQGWEDIHEVSLLLPEGRAYFNTPTGWEMKDVGTIVGEQKGSYRARLYATGRDTAFDLVVDSSVERHLIQFWKEAQEPAAFHQNVAGTPNCHRSG